MASRKPRQPHSEYCSIAVRIDSYQAALESALNFSIKFNDPRFVREDEPVFTSVTSLEVSGTALFPVARAGDQFRITLRGENDLSGWLGMKLKDIQKRDVHGSPVFRMRRGEYVPEYVPPYGLAVLEKERGTNIWKAWVPVQQALASDMLVLLNHCKLTYLDIREHRLDRRRWIESLALNTKEPLTENY